MVWLEDPLTGDVPHRGVVEEEDEAQAAELAPQYAAAPAVQVGRPHRRNMPCMRVEASLPNYSNYSMA